MSFAPALVLREGDRRKLGDLARLPSVPSGLAKRARMILLAGDGVPNAEIARVTGVSRPTVIAWRDRYVAFDSFRGAVNWGSGVEDREEVLNRRLFD
jgi:hypothetical protein